ncbi:MAG TPA: nickel pincer cofactor biosynthesis protein LarC, partial [Planctomycetota bacterium]|nr:nickel pincer cofactor biosynthesis protein LarC [Planctomycetota bacterium]
MRVIYFDCPTGASGDMIVAALIDAGLSVDVLRDELAKLPLEGYRVDAKRVTRAGIAGTKFDVTVEGQETHRHLGHIVKILDESDLSERVKRDSLAVFRRLAEAEARVHDTEVEKVHFHEVGAVDAIVDVVAAAVGLEKLGVREVICGALPTGSGFVRCAHGRLPVPAPATAELLGGFPVAASDLEAELTTPTGAAILTTLAARFGRRPAMTVETVGLGAGTQDFDDIPNLLRVFLGETADVGDTDRVWVLETNIDDMSAELFETLFERLLELGALDVFTTPVQMKKNRPAVMLSTLVPAALRSRA